MPPRLKKQYVNLIRTALGIAACFGSSALKQSHASQEAPSIATQLREKGLLRTEYNNVLLADRCGERECEQNRARRSV